MTLNIWLDTALQEMKSLEKILRTGYVLNITGYPVSTIVNSARNNGPDCIKPEGSNPVYA